MKDYYYKISLDDGTEYIQKDCPRVNVVSNALLEEMRIDESQIGDGVTITKVDAEGNEYDVDLEELGLTEEDYEVDKNEEE